jgi:hypothetical protein
MVGRGLTGFRAGRAEKPASFPVKRQIITGIPILIDFTTKYARDNPRA